MRALGLVLVASVLGYYICSGMPQASEHVFPQTMALHAVTFALAAGYAVYLLARRRLPGGSPLDWPLTALLAVYFVATLASVNPQVSLENTLMLVAAVLIFYILSDIHLLGPATLQRGLMLAGMAASFWALWNVAGSYGDWLDFARATRGSFHLGDLIPPTVPKVHGVSDHPNILGMVLTLIIPFYVLAAYRAPYAWERLFWGVALLAAAWAVFLTLSRGAWVGALTGGALTAVAMAVQLAGRERQERIRELRAALRRRSLLIAAGALAAAALVAALAVVVLMRWESRPQWLFRESLSPRQDVFSAGIDMFRDFPLLGSGPGTFSLLYPEYSGEYPVHAIHAHNGLIQAAVDAGVLGLLALVLLGGFVAWMLVRTYRAGSTGDRLTVIAAGGALAGFAAHNMADAANTWKAPLIALAAVLALVVANYRAVVAERSTPANPGDPAGGRLSLPRLLPALPRVVIAIAIAGLFLLWARIDIAHHDYSQSIGYLNEGRKMEAVREARDAVSGEEGLAIYHLQLGLTEVLAFNADGPQVLLQQAIEHLQRGVELEPRGPIGHANLARALEMAGRDEEARSEALEAQRLAGADPTVLLAAAAVLEDIGAEEDAVETYAMAITRMSSLAGSSFWMASDFRREHYQEIIDGSALALNPCGKGRVLALIGEQQEALSPGAAGLVDDCALSVLGNPDNMEARVDFGEMLMALGDYDQARDHLKLAVQRQPDFGRARTALGKWYAHEGDIESARQEWILGSQLGEAESMVLLGDTYPPGQVPEKLVRRLEGLEPMWAGPVRYYEIGYVYYHMKFARESPPSTLLPGDWQTAMPREYTITMAALQRWRTAR
ncbi:MAG: O-antigen ligase family protein [Dehalococcoidia bacterium]|nr:O-antigen ligase family protein [Dehalococcoidia bacterium]